MKKLILFLSLISTLVALPVFAEEMQLNPSQVSFGHDRIVTYNGSTLYYVLVLNIDGVSVASTRMDLRFLGDRIEDLTKVIAEAKSKNKKVILDPTDFEKSGYSTIKISSSDADMDYKKEYEVIKDENRSLHKEIAKLKAKLSFCR